MAVRGIYTSLIFYPEVYTPPGTPIATYQNYSPNPIPDTISGTVYNFEYRPFSMSSTVSDANSLTNDFSLTFAATGATVDFLETALLNRYEVIAVTSVWAGTIDTPSISSNDIYALSYGNVIDAELDFATITIRVGQYASGTEADLPWRRIPWTILGPLLTRN